VPRTYKLHGERNFKWRGADVSRIENLSDIVFALVLALAATQSIPQSFDELKTLWRDALSLAFCFAIILMIWRTHHAFFRRYDLQDSFVVTINAVLLFLLLVYIYPLKFMADFTINLFTFGFTAENPPSDILSYSQLKWLYLIYGGFFAAVFGLFAPLYAHALKHADAIGLDTRERAYTRFEVEFAVGAVGLSILVIGGAFLLPPLISPYVGGLYSFMGLIPSVCRRRAEARLSAEQSP
jgi:uncharacterized membrane protein